MELKNTVVKFKVAMDAEQAKAKNHQEVEFTVTFEGADEAKVVEMALKAQVVAWQSQVRAHWDEFISEGLPKTVVFGEALFATTRGAVTVAKAMDKVKEELNKLPPKERFARMKDEGMISKEMYEQMMEMLG